MLVIFLCTCITNLALTASIALALLLRNQTLRASQSEPFNSVQLKVIESLVKQTVQLYSSSRSIGSACSLPLINRIGSFQWSNNGGTYPVSALALVGSGFKSGKVQPCIALSFCPTYTDKERLVRTSQAPSEILSHLHNLQVSLIFSLLFSTPNKPSSKSHLTPNPANQLSCHTLMIL